MASAPDTAVAPSPGAACPSDAALSAAMARFRLTRRAADFEDLYRGARAAVLGWVVASVRRQRVPLDPFDLVQDTFVNIYRYAEGFRHEDDGSFRRWAKTIANNIVRRASRPRSGALGALGTAGLASEVGEPPDPAPGPCLRLEHAEREGELRQAYGLVLLHYARAFAALAPRDQAALTLVEVEGLAYREVGERLGVGASNTKMIVFRARQRLARELHGAFTAAGEACLEPRTTALPVDGRAARCA